MSNDKVDNFEIGQTKSSDDMTYDEMVVLFGEPVATELLRARILKDRKSKSLTVKKIDIKNKTIVVG